MNRRELVKMLPAVGVAVIAADVAPAAAAHEIKPEKNYLVVLPEPPHMPPTEAFLRGMEQFQKYLKLHGFENIAVVCGDLAIYELEK